MLIWRRFQLFVSPSLRRTVWEEDKIEMLICSSKFNGFFFNLKSNIFIKLDPRVEQNSEYALSGTLEALESSKMSQQGILSWRVNKVLRGLICSQMVVKLVYNQNMLSEAFRIDLKALSENQQYNIYPLLRKSRTSNQFRQLKRKLKLAYIFSLWAGFQSRHSKRISTSNGRETFVE